MSYPILKPSNTWFTPTVSTINRDTITAINIVDSYTPTTIPTDSWDASAAQDGSITVYVEGTKLTISGNGSGKIAANENASYMLAEFGSATSINGLNILDTSNTTDMSYMFFKSYGLLSIDVSSFNVSNVKTMEYMFGSDSSSKAMKLNSINFGSNFNTSNVESFFAMFRWCSSIENLDVSNFDTKSATNMERMFDRCNKLKYVDVSNFVTDNVKTMSTMFQLCYVINNIDVSKWNTSNCEDMGYMFNNCQALTELKAENFNTSKVKTMKQMLQQCNSLKSFSVKNWDVSNCEDLSYLFYGCKSFKSVDFDNWDVSNVTDFNHFMAHAWMEEFDVSKWKVTSKCTNMNAMFHTAMVKYLDVSGFDTSNVTTMSQMFENNERVEEIKGLENFNTSKVTSFQDMFNNAFAIRKLNLSSFDTRNILSVSNMFNRVTLDEFSIGDNYVFTGDQNYQSHFFPNSTTGYWYSLYGEEYLPDEVPRGKAMSYYSTRERAKEALVELNGKKYVNLNSLSVFHDLQNVEIDTKINTLREELGNIEEISSEEIQALFGVNV